MFDAVLDFDRATLDPQTGGLKPEFVPDSTAGGPGDKLHPNRVGYLAIATSIDLKTLLGKELQPATRESAMTSRRVVISLYLFVRA